MRALLVRIMLCASFVLFAAPAVVRAAPAPGASSPSASELAEAKKHFDTGMKLYKARVFESAILEFREAYRLSHRPTALKNVALCHREQGEFADAYETFGLVLQDHEAELKPKEKDDIRAALNDLALVTALVDVRLNEKDAEVQIDGKRVGTSPIGKKIRVKAASHHFHASKLGFEPADQDVTVVGQSDVVVNLEVKPAVTTGHLAVKEKSGKAVAVIVDGREVGPAPWEGEVAPGAHVVSGKGDGLAVRERTVEVALKGSAVVELEAVVAVGTVRVTSNVAAASIAVDGKPAGEGSWSGELLEGAHRLDVVAPGYKAFTRDLDVVAGRSFVVGVELVPDAPASAPAGPSDDDYRGIYARLDGLAAFTAAGSPPLCPTPVPTNATCKPGTPFGFGGTVRVGHSFGVVGVEGVAAFLYQTSSEEDDYAGTRTPSSTALDSTVKHTEQLKLTSVSVFVGPGLRFMSQNAAVRFTLGLAPGFAFRSFSLSRAVSDAGNDSASASASQPTFAFLGDAGILIGSTPGPKLFVGAQIWTDVAGPQTDADPSHTVRSAAGTALAFPLPSYTMASSPNVYVGPVLGVQFGH